MKNTLQFDSRAAFRSWLRENCRSDDGIWLLFGKAGGPVTITANEALEEALCFGWIDGQMQSVDDRTYRKYFAPRRENSKWSEKNRALADQLEKNGSMTEYGRAKIAEARKNGQWDVPKSPPVTGEQIAAVAELLKGHEPAHGNFLAMSPSVQRTYTRGYLAAKTDAGRKKRLAWMVERLNQNLKPM